MTIKTKEKIFHWVEEITLCVILLTLVLYYVGGISRMAMHILWLFELFAYTVIRLRW